MGINKIQFGNTTLIDLTSDTVTADKLMQGYTAHDRTGAIITGTATGGGGGNVWQDSQGFVHLDDEGGGGDTWSWVGRNPVKLQEWTETLSFADLGVDDWTYSTSTTSLRAAQNLTPTTVCDFESYDYVIVQKVEVSYDYGVWAPVDALIKFAYVGSITVCGYSSTYSSARSSTLSNVTTSSVGAYHSYYYNASGAEGFIGNTYGIYTTSVSTPTTSGTMASRTVQWKTPPITARGNATYFSETAYENLDMNNSSYKAVIEIWRIDRGSKEKSFAEAASIDILNNGL